jgi:hypothetical protein
MWNLQYRGRTYEVEFVPFVIFVKYNTQEGDQICGLYTAKFGAAHAKKRIIPKQNFLSRRSP